MGIVQRVRSCDGVRTFYIDFRDQQGRRLRELAGTTRKQARDLLTQRLGEVRSGTYVNPRDRDRTRGPTVKEFVERFLAEHPGRRRSNHYSTTLKHTIAFLGDKPLREITRADLDRFRVSLLTEKAPRIGRPLSSTTVLKILRTTGRVFKMAVRWDVLDVNPASELEKPSVPRPKTRFLTLEEFYALEAAAPEWLRPILRTAVSTGMRLKEVVGLRWEDMDRSAGVIHISEDSKTGRRDIPLPQSVMELLGDQVRHIRSSRVFLDSEGRDFASPAGRNRVSRMTVKAMRDASVEDASFHTLRHTAAAWMVQAGVSLYEVQQVLGHSTPMMTQRYAHLQPDHLRRAVRALDTKLKRRHDRESSPAGQK